MGLVGYDELNVTLLDWDLWWKACTDNTLEEIRYIRGRMSAGIKKSCTQGK